MLSRALRSFHLRNPKNHEAVHYCNCPQAMLLGILCIYYGGNCCEKTLDPSAVTGSEGSVTHEIESESVYEPATIKAPPHGYLASMLIAIRTSTTDPFMTESASQDDQHRPFS